MSSDLVSALQNGVSAVNNLTAKLKALSVGANIATINSEIAILIEKTNFLVPQQYGAVGDGVTDDTVAMQNWLNAVGAGIPGYMAPGNYLISSEITITNTGPSIYIFGAGQQNAQITLASPTQNGLTLNGNRFIVTNFTIQAANAASAGACLNVTSGGFSIIDGIVTFGSWNGIQITNSSSMVITKCFLAALNNCIDYTNPGDATICECNLSPTNGNAGIIIGGSAAGCRIVNNKINGQNYPYGISVIIGTTDGDLFVESNSIEGYTSYGMILSRSGNFTHNNVNIIGNEFSPNTGGRGISLAQDTGTRYLSKVVISGNVIVENLTGIGLGNVGDLIITGNNIYSGNGTGIDIGSGSTGTVYGNIIRDQSVAINNAASAVTIFDNLGYNPVGASSLTPGASPWTYTAGASPETIYISDTVGITNVTFSGTSILPHSTAANQPLTLEVGPLEAVVITYSGVLTGNRMIH